MNAIRDVSNRMASSLASIKQPSCYFTSLPQAIVCANKFFMEGINAQIIARDENTFLVVSPDLANKMYTRGFQLLYGD